jgi:hypothetical protein
MKHINKVSLGLLGLGLFIGHTAHAQLGVKLGGATPQTSLDVNGAITTRPVSVAVSGNAAVLPANAGQIVLTGSASADIVLTTATPFPGQILMLVNNTTGGQRALLNGIPINNGQALVFTGDAASSNFKSADNGFAAGANTTYWNLKGNAGTNPATNFLGTTDAQDQAFRTSNSERMRILAGGNVGIGATAPKSTLEVNGSFGANYLNTSAAAYTLLPTDYFVSYNGAGAGTLTLPSGLNVKGRLYTIKNNTAAQTLTLNATGSETINGSTTLSIPAGQSVQVVTTGATSGAATYEVVEYSPASTSPALATASNGLTATNGNVKLGGALTANTEVATGTTNGTNNLSLTGKGYLGLGLGAGVAPAGKLHIVTEASTGQAEDDYIFDDYASSIAGMSNNIFLRTSRGTVATPSASVSGDPLGGVVFAPRITGGANPGLQYNGSGVAGFYKGDGTTIATDLRFSTSANEWMRLDETGRLGIGTKTPQSTLEVNGSFGANYLNTAAPAYTLLPTDYFVAYNGTGNGTLALPAGLTVKGRLYTIKNNTPTQTLTLTTTGGETINGATSLSIPNGQSVQVMSTGATTGLATYEVVSYNAATTSPALSMASNGLTATNGNIALGGTITGVTAINVGVSTATNTNLTFNVGSATGNNLKIAGTGVTTTFSTSGRVGVNTTAPASTLEVNGSFGANYRNITAATYTLLSTEYYVVYTGTTASTFTLPAGIVPTAPVKGRLYTIKNNSAGQTLTVNTTASETIDGQLTITIPAGQSVQLMTTGATTGLAAYEIVNFSAATSAGAGAGVTASNGLTATNGNLKLGGTLTAATDVATAGFPLTFSGTGKVAIGTASTLGVLNISGAMGSSFTGGVNITNTTGAPSGSTLSITPGYAGATGITTGAVAMYDVPNVGNQIFSDNVIPNGTNVNMLGDAVNRWSSVFGVNADFSGSLTANASSPAASLTATATDYFVVAQAALTYTLPSASASKGRTLIFYAFGGAITINIVAGGGGLYDQANFATTAGTTTTLARYHRITFISDGTNWISTAYL